MDKRTFLHGVIATAATGLGVPSFANDAWPSRAIRIITPVPAGGSGDVIAREFGTKLAERLGQPVIIDNRPGANGAIATVATARAPADGYTLMMTLTQHIQAPLQVKDVGYDPFADFTPLTRIGAAVTLLVARPQLNLRNAADLVREAPGKKFSYATTATGPQVVMGAFNNRNNLNMLNVPYKGEPQALQDLLGGQIDIALLTVATARPHVLSGKLTALAISAPTRAPSLPQVPTLGEQGYPEFNWIGWYGFMAPAKLPAPIARRLMTEFKAILDDPATRARLDGMDVMINWAEGQAFYDGMKADTEKWAAMIQRSGIKFDR